MPASLIKLGAQAQGRLFAGLKAGNPGTKKLVLLIEKEVAEYGIYLVKTRLGEVLQNPTGYYESQVQVSNMATDYVLHDNNVIYGPWLEGTSPRNAQTNFPGYHTFRTVTRQLDQLKTKIGQPIVSDYIRGMNG